MALLYLIVVVIELVVFGLLGFIVGLLGFALYRLLRALIQWLVSPRRARQGERR